VCSVGKIKEKNYFALGCINANKQTYVRSRWSVLLRIFGGGVPPASPNPDPISDQKGLLFEERDPGNEVEKKADVTDATGGFENDLDLKNLKEKQILS